MSDETRIESDVVSNRISVSLDEYNALQRTVESQGHKLKATKNLHQMILSKDHELKSIQERNQNLQAALDRAEMRLANQIRLTVSGGFYPSVTEFIVEKSIPQSEDLSHTLERRQQSRVPADDASSASSDLEADCAITVELPSRPQFVHGSPVLSTSLHKSSDHISKSRTEVSGPPAPSPRDSFSDDSHIMNSRGVKLSSPPPCQSVSKDSFASIASSSTSQNFKSFPGAGVSKDLLDKLMQQNARLKKVVRDILNKQGMSLNDYLDKQEMSDVVEQLREELRLSKMQNEKLKEIINAKDTEDTVKKYAELNLNFQKLKRTATVTKAMADAYSKEAESLKQENKELKEKAYTQSCKRKSLEPSGERELSNNASVTPGGLEQGSIASSAYINSLKMQLKQMSEQLKSAEQELVALRLQCQKQDELLTEKEAKILDFEMLKEQVEQLQSERQLLQKQNSMFHEDFIAERKENAEKQRQNETSIAKHQEWIKKLVAEAQRCRNLFEEEKTKRIQSETMLNDVNARFLSHIEQSRTGNRGFMSNCGMSENCLGRVRNDDLQVDLPSESVSLPCNMQQPEELKSPGMCAGMEQELEAGLVCPRCDRVFEAKDRKKWQEHCARCTDD